ncbi:MAG: hypothetical protein M1831_005420 [Alyxoria varia]|nr:MAG: hypothetical protein M1831_005420 [Alyxoria varia]
MPTPSEEARDEPFQQSSFFHRLPTELRLEIYNFVYGYSKDGHPINQTEYEVLDKKHAETGGLPGGHLRKRLNDSLALRQTCRLIYNEVKTMSLKNVEYVIDASSGCNCQKCFEVWEKASTDPCRRHFLVSGYPLYFVCGANFAKQALLRRGKPRLRKDIRFITFKASHPTYWSEPRPWSAWRPNFEYSEINHNLNVTLECFTLVVSPYNDGKSESKMDSETVDWCMMRNLFPYCSSYELHIKGYTGPRWYLSNSGADRCAKSPICARGLVSTASVVLFLVRLSH